MKKERAALLVFCAHERLVIRWRKFKNLLGNISAAERTGSAYLSFLSFSLFLFIVSSHGELVFHRAAIYFRCVHNCPRWKSHLLTNFVTCPRQFPRISSPFSFPARALPPKKPNALSVRFWQKIAQEFVSSVNQPTRVRFNCDWRFAAWSKLSWTKLKRKSSVYIVQIIVCIWQIYITIQHYNLLIINQI